LFLGAAIIRAQVARDKRSIIIIVIMANPLTVSPTTMANPAELTVDLVGEEGLALLLVLPVLE
jgi:hypothetical protein